MADTRAVAGLTPQIWDDKFFTEYLQENRFADLMGSDEMSVIQVKEDLTKKRGDTITFALVNKLTQSAITGSNVLEGNEERMDSRSHTLTVDQRRNGVVVSVMEEQKSAIGLREAARAVLKDWAMEDTRDLIITALESINGTAYASATEANKDAWLVDNADRVLFGAAVANNVANDHSDCLATIDSTNDRLTGSAISLLKRRALLAAPKLRPVRDEGSGKRFFIAFAHPYLMRDLRNDPVVMQAQREVGLMEENSRIFRGGDILWDNVIVKEVDDLNLISGVGASSIDVGRFHLLGAQAVAVGYASRWKTKTQTTDYEDKAGVAVAAIYGVNKMRFGSGTGDTDDSKDHGAATGYFAAVADS